MAERNVAAYFYGSTNTEAPRTMNRDDTLRAVRACLGGPGVAVFEAMERVDPKERGRLASVLQAEYRRLMQHRIEPVLPRSARKPAEQPETGTRRR